MGLFDGLFEYKFGKPEAKPATIGRAVYGGDKSNGQWLQNDKWNVDTAVNSAYSKVVWAFRAVHTIASSQANLNIQLVDTGTEYNQIQDDPQLWRLLNRQANPYETAWAFRYRLSSQCLLSPKGAFIEIVRDGMGDPSELYLLDPGSTEPIKDSRRWVSGYRVHRSEHNTEILPTKNILWVRTTPHPTDPYRNMTALEPAGISVETDFFARLFNKNFLKNDGRPGLLIGIDADMDPDDAEELSFILNGSASTVGQVKVIESENLNVVDLGSKPRDAQWSEALNSAKDNILTAFGVPESVLGNASGRCLRASELVHLASGEVKPAEQLVGQQFELFQPRNDGIAAVTAKAEYARDEKIYRIKTFSGRTLETNGEHPLYLGISTGVGQRGVWKRDLFPYGWTPMAEIKEQFDNNDRSKKGTYTEVAVPIEFPQLERQEVDSDTVIQDADLFVDVPDYLFQAEEDAQKLFLSKIYSDNGKTSQHTGVDIHVPTGEYAQKLQRLLLRLGIYGNVGVKRQQHTVEILTKPNILHFFDTIPLEGSKSATAESVKKRLETRKNYSIHTFRNDGLPPKMMWDRVLEVEEIGTDQTVAITIIDSRERHYLSMFWEHNTYNNADAEGEFFWMNTMKTHCDSLARAMEPLSGSNKDTINLEFDYDEIDVLQRANRRKLDKYRQDLNNGVINIDDYLELLGREPLDIPYSRVYWHPNGVIGGSPEDVLAVSQLPNISQPANPFLTGTPTGGDGVVGGINDQVQGELAASGGDAAQTTFDQAARTLRSSVGNSKPPESVNPRASSEIQDRVNDLINRKTIRSEAKVREDPYRDLRAKTQGFIEGSLESWSNRQLGVVGDRVSHTKVRKGTRHWQGSEGTKSLDVGYIVDVKEWSDDIVTTVRTVLATNLRAEGSKRVNDLRDAGVKVDSVSSEQINSLVNEVVQILEKSVTSQSALVQRHIGVLDTSGKSIQEIQATLKPENFDRNSWIQLVAKRLTTRSIESLNSLIFSQVEGKVQKTWKTANNEMFRDSHAALNNKTIDGNDTFQVGSVKMRFPSDTIGEEGDSCGCWIYHEVNKS